MEQKKVITYGTYDLLHHGHVRLLRRAKEIGHFLIVALSTDDFNREKGKQSVLNYKQRKEVVESLKFVDLVIPEENWGQKESDIKEHGVDVFVMGDDWKGEFDFLEGFCEVKYLPRTSGISTTEIKKKICKEI